MSPSEDRVLGSLIGYSDLFRHSSDVRDQKLIILMFVKCSLPEYQLTWISLRLRTRCPLAVFMVMIGQVASRGVTTTVTQVWR